MNHVFAARCICASLAKVSFGPTWIVLVFSGGGEAMAKLVGP